MVETTGVVGLFAGTILLILHISSVMMPNYRNKKRRVFSAVLSFSGLYLYIVGAEALMTGALEESFAILKDSAFAIFCLLFSEYIFKLIQEEGKISKTFRSVVTPLVLASWVIQIILDINQIMPIFKSGIESVIRLNNSSVLCLFLVGMINVGMVFAGLSFIRTRDVVALLMAIMVMMVGGVLQEVLYKPYFLGWAVTLSVIELYAFDYMEGAWQYVSMQSTMTDQRVQIVTDDLHLELFMKVVDKISHMHNEDTDEARRAASALFGYLRNGSEAMKEISLVTFTRELSNVKRYLYLIEYAEDVQVRVEYEIEWVDFELPSRTILVLIQQMIQHMQETGLEDKIIRIHAYEYDNGYRLDLSDNHPISIMKDRRVREDAKKCLRKMKQRVMIMCDGDVTYNKTPDGKGMFSIFIPETEY